MMDQEAVPDHLPPVSRHIPRIGIFQKFCPFGPQGPGGHHRRRCRPAAAGLAAPAGQIPEEPVRVEVLQVFEHDGIETDGLAMRVKMGEIGAADDQGPPARDGSGDHLRQPPARPLVLGAHDQRHERELPEGHLQKGKLDFQGVFPGVCCGDLGDRPVRVQERLRQFLVHRCHPQGGLVTGSPPEGDTVEVHAMGRGNDDHLFVGRIPDQFVRVGRYLAGIDVSRVRGHEADDAARDLPFGYVPEVRLDVSPEGLGPAGIPGTGQDRPPDFLFHGNILPKGRLRAPPPIT
jgi:hypothetical protein